MPLLRGFASFARVPARFEIIFRFLWQDLFQDLA